MKPIISILLLSTMLLTSALEAEPSNSSVVKNPRFSASNLVRMSLNNIHKNYPAENNMMTAFYRESINKNSSSLSCNEAILDINKSSYLNSQDDKIVIRKARCNNPVLQGTDAIMLKLQGGPSSALFIDVAKYPFLGTKVAEIEDSYTFRYSKPEVIDNVSYYVVEFDEKVAGEQILYRGKLFIEKNSLAIGRVEFAMNVESRGDAYMNFLMHKPASMKMDVKSAKYTVNYKKYIDKWYFDYSVSEIKFNIKADRKSAGNEYTLKSQLAVTSFLTKDIHIDKKDLLKPADILADKINQYDDGTDWEIYNKIMYLAMGK